MLRVPDFIKRLFESDDETSLRVATEEAETLEEEQEYEEGLIISRRSFERENDHVPADEYFDTSSEVLVRTIEEHRGALDQVLSHPELLDPYVEDLKTKVPYYRSRKRLFNYINRFPGARASIDRIRQKIEEELKEK